MRKPRTGSTMGGGSAHIARSAGALARATLENGAGWMPTAPAIVGDNPAQVNGGAAGAVIPQRSRGDYPGPRNKNGRGIPGRLRNIVVGGTGFEPVTPTMSR